MKIVGIYKISNLKNHNFYIGLSRNIMKRFDNHKYDLRKNEHRNSHLQHAWNKYGEESFLFEIIEECSEEKLNERELYWINYYGGYTNPNLYNIRDGGDSLKHSKETIEKIRKSNLGNPCFWKGKHLTDETKDKISKKNKGRKLSPEHKKIAISTLNEYWKNKPGYWAGKTMSEEHRKKLSESHKGHKSWNKGNHNKISEETRQKLVQSHLGHRHTEETKIKMSKRHKGKIISAETREKIRQANIGKSRKWIYKDGISKTIKPELLEQYLLLGWKQGRICDKIWINNNQKEKRIDEKDLNTYINEGWKKGRLYAPRNI